jgi:hypothetical protein
MAFFQTVGEFRALLVAQTNTADADNALCSVFQHGVFMVISALKATQRNGTAQFQINSSKIQAKETQTGKERQRSKPE